MPHTTRDRQPVFHGSILVGYQQPAMIIENTVPVPVSVHNHSRAQRGRSHRPTTGGDDSSDSDGEGGEPPPPFERNFTFRQIRQAGILPKSDRTLKRIFENEPGVIVLPSFGKKKQNHHYLVPASVIQRVLRKNQVPTLQGVNR